MELFNRFKSALRDTLNAVRFRQGTINGELSSLIEDSDNWEGLETRLLEARTLSRRRQQEILERLEPLAGRVEQLLAGARSAKIKVVRQNLLRQADSFMRELESEDEAAKIHSNNCALITDLLKQVRRAKAMGERGVDAGAIDMIASHLGEFAEDHAAAFEAAEEMESAVSPASVGRESSAADVARRLSSVCVTEEPDAPSTDARGEMENIQDRLFAETA